MIRYWEEDTETEIGRSFDLEKHDKAISNKWLEKVKQAREEIKKKIGTPVCGEYIKQGHDWGLHEALAVLDRLIESEEEE